jgi:hypothetical protein
LILTTTSKSLFAQDTARLEHRFVPGQSLRYRVTALVTIGATQDVSKPGSEQVVPVRIAGEFVRQVRQVHQNGDAEIVYTFSSFKANYGGGDVDLPPMNQIAALVDKDGAIKSMVGASGNPLEQLTFMNPTTFGQLSAAFIERDLKTGDSWSKESVFGLGGKNSGRMKANYALVGLSTNPSGESLAAFDEKEAGRAEYTVSDNQSAEMHALNIWQAENRFSFSLSWGCVTATDGSSTTRMTITVPASQDKAAQVANIDVKIKYQVALVPNAK